MMESCFYNKLESVEREVNFDDLKKNLFSEFNSIDSQESCLEEHEHLQVYLRIRPFTTTESENGESQDCVSIELPDTVLLKAPRTSLSARLRDKSAQRFQFSQVLGPETTQREMFDSTVRGLVKEVLEGGNSLVFTYGVTNAGKTFTFLGPEANGGILPRSLNVIFNSIEGRVYDQMTIKPQRCREFIRLTKDQQSEEATNKRNLFRLLKESDNQKSFTNKTTLEGSTLSDIEGTVTEQRFSLVVEAHTKFSVWVSFCEIYNENIHDLLEPVPIGAQKRTTLRLSQDVKGNSFVKDLKWVQVNNAEEAYKVMKLGKKNQSFSSTKLNLLSSRSHSIFSVRILRMEDARIPRVNSISELSLCDLAGSERCAKTQNKGERLKEAGNINTSLMTLGKCINTLRQSQQSKLPQHVPFRESKLTHYLQGFFCGRGKACMIVNINQCASMYDETLNVLKFSAVAQKVVVLTTKTVPHLATKRSARELSMIINNADRKYLLGQKRRSSLVGWETSLEDVQEHDDTEESVMETMQEVDDEKVLINKDTYESQLLQLTELWEQLQKERSENIALESRIRDEITKEFFSEMQTDYNERLAKEKNVDERAEKRLEILRNLVNINTSQEDLDRVERTTEDSSPLGQMFDSMCSDLAGIKKAALEAKTCLVVTQPSGETISNLGKRVDDLSALLNQAQEQLTVKTNELEHCCKQARQSNEQLEEARKTLESQELKFSYFLEMCHEKDEMITTLQNTVDQQVQATIKNKATFDGIKNEILQLKSSCSCSRGERPSSRAASRKRLVDLQANLEDQPPSKKGFLGKGEEEMDRLHRELLEVQKDSGLLRDKLMEQKRKFPKTLDESEKRPLQKMGLGEKLTQQQISEQQLEVLKEKLAPQELNLEQLRAEMEEAKAMAHIDSENSIAEVVTLKGKVAALEEKQCTHQTEREAAVTVSQSYNDELMSQMERVAELEKTLFEKEAQVSGLQRSLREMREDEETATVREARERRRELLAVAEEAITQKNAELERRVQVITRLKETAKHDSDKVKSLSLDLERKDDDVSDLKEKLSDSKKQILQVQIEIISMREEAKSLKLKLQDLEKVKKRQQADLANKDRTIQQLKTEQSADENLKLNPNACKDLQAKERMMEDMRLALIEQEDTQTQQEQVLEAKLDEIDALIEEVDKLKGLLRYQDSGKDTGALRDSQSDEAKLAIQEAVQAQVTLKLCTEKHQADKRKWLEEKTVLIRLAKEAEDKRNQEMRKFADGRKRHAKQQAQVEGLVAQLSEKEQDLLKWRKERDSLVTALEVQLTKLLSSNADKDEQIASLRCHASSQPADKDEQIGSLRCHASSQPADKDEQIASLRCHASSQPADKDEQIASLRCHASSQPAERDHGQVEVVELQGLLSDRDTEILNLKEQLKTAFKASSDASVPTKHRETANQLSQTEAEECPSKVRERTLHDNGQLVRDVKTSRRTSQGSGGYPSVLDSSEIITEGGRTSRFPKPELEISFSPLQPNRMALKRQGEDVINVKITRKRKSSEIDKSGWRSPAKRRATHELPSQDEVHKENHRNPRTRLAPKLAVHQEVPSPAWGSKYPGSIRPHDSQSSLHSRKDGTMQKIGVFGSKAKKIMGLVSGKSPETESSMSFRPMKSKWKLYRPEISSAIDFSSHPIISGVPDEKESDHLIVKRELRTEVKDAAL
ncbi:kinesin-like protein KIF20B isoform X3 [Oncorhynchus kisutch]|uniref:kinesin-like protein KIF20B isoform X3 n=1 Tax=Oncorhynchus kisutch TaxID=8019 RepID=UPI0012DE3B2D|nr:kinesin-like protein KIF20B isoform X3 [Oncorhynchus kisutch]